MGVAEFDGKVAWRILSCPTVAGDRDVVFDVDSTLIFMLTEAGGVATRCWIWAGPLSKNVQRPNSLFSNICFEEE